MILDLGKMEMFFGFRIFLNFPDLTFYQGLNSIFISPEKQKGDLDYFSMLFFVLLADHVHCALCCSTLAES
jgi:hypothetical protein